MSSVVSRIVEWPLRLKLALTLTAIFSAYFLFSYFSTPNPSHVEDRAVIIDALAFDRPNQEFVQSAMESLNSAGFSVDLINGSDVTVDALKKLPSGYGIVVFRVHSEAFMNQVFLFTAEPYSDFKYLAEQMRFEVTGARPGGVGETVFAVGLNFMRKYMADKFDGSLVIVMGCRGLYRGSQKPGQEGLGSAFQTAEWFMKEGTSAYISWDGLVDLDHTDRATALLLEAICVDEFDVADAVEKVMAEVGPDAHGSKLYYVTSDSI